MRFLIVTGLSGAGKTSALRHLEDIFRMGSRYELGFWDMAWNMAE